MESKRCYRPRTVLPRRRPHVGGTQDCPTGVRPESGWQPAPCHQRGSPPKTASGGSTRALYCRTTGGDRDIVAGGRSRTSPRHASSGKRGCARFRRWGEAPIATCAESSLREAQDKPRGCATLLRTGNPDARHEATGGRWLGAAAALPWQERRTAGASTRDGLEAAIAAAVARAQFTPSGKYRQEASVRSFCGSELQAAAQAARRGACRTPPVGASGRRQLPENRTDRVREGYSRHRRAQATDQDLYTYQATSARPTRQIATADGSTSARCDRPCLAVREAARLVRPPSRDRAYAQTAARCDHTRARRHGTSGNACLPSATVDLHEPHLPRSWRRWLRRSPYPCRGRCSVASRRRPPARANRPASSRPGSRLRAPGYGTAWTRL